MKTLLLFALMAPVAALSQPLTAVNLGSTANFAVLAGSLVSNIPTSAVTGDIGLSPAAGSKITGFGMTEVTGTIFTVDASGPAGSTVAATRLTAAKGDLTIAYNDAAGRMPVPTGPFLNPGAGNIGGLTLVPGLYKFTSTAAITGSDVTLSGSATDVWIFQIATNLNVGTGIKVILAGGAQASNIFWQVGTSATLGTTSVFKGTIMADQSISLNTGARLDGRALARIAAVTLASNIITRPSLITHIGGQVTTGGTTPVSGAKVVLIVGNSHIDSVTTDPAGAYSFNSQIDSISLARDTTGIKQVQASKASLITTVSAAVSTTLNIDLALATGAGTLSGTVRRTSDSVLVAGAKVVLKRGTLAVDSLLTDAQGRYSFSNTAGVNYSLTTSATAFYTLATPAVITANSSVALNLYLLAPAKITGILTNVVNSDIRVPMTNVLVLLRRGSKTTAISDSVRTNAQGTYTFANLVPGAPNCWVTAVSTIGTSTHDSIAIRSGATVTSNFIFDQSTALFVPSFASQGFRLTTAGNRLVLDLAVSSSMRTVSIFNLNGTLRHQIIIPAGESHVSIPGSFSPENGFLFRIK